MGLREQVQTCKTITSYIDTINENTRTNDIIKNISEIISSRNTLDQEDYEAICEYTSLSLNMEKLSINEISSIMTVFENSNVRDIENVTEAFVNADGKLPLGIGLDKDGSILIKKQLSMDYKGVFAQSHRLLKTYEMSKNIAGMKYELAKQWFLLHMIENKVLYNKNFITSKLITKTKKKTATEVRSFILNDYKKYIKIILDKDPNFNFNEFFKTSPFYTETYKIDKRILQTVIPMM